ncbi:MAG TPA: DUF2726 domain-containing protein [Sphingorhabdus sp.]|jgi:very-short-patch-repair endonuclease|nr:DUF2726 domain-containing protein [Sphingorhabdus sp.]
MKVVERLINRSEEVVYRELGRIADDNGLRVLSKTRMSDVIDKGGKHLTQRVFDYFTRAHFDFVILDSAFRPLMVVEYDGPMHADARQLERDRIKNGLCRDAGLGMLRINDRHVTKLYRGMTVLRWIVEVTELAKDFETAQANGQIPWDEPFDPACFASTGKTSFPYWLSAPATRAIHAFDKQLGADAKFGWASFSGRDADDTAGRLSYLWFNGQVLWAVTAVRRQDLDFPHYDLLSEIDGCELGERLAAYQCGQLRPSSSSEFRRVFDRFRTRYDPHPSHSMGESPLDFVWDPMSGIKMR